MLNFAVSLPSLYSKVRVSGSCPMVAGIDICHLPDRSTSPAGSAREHELKEPATKMEQAAISRYLVGRDNLFVFITSNLKFYRIAISVATAGSDHNLKVHFQVFAPWRGILLNNFHN